MCFFQFEKDIGQSICKVCGAKLAARHVTNLKRHLNAKHQDVFNLLKDDNSIEVQKIVKKRKISSETDEESITASLVRIVANEGRPVLLLDGEGFRNILTPIYNALEMTPITSRSIMDHVRAKDIAIKEDIKASVKRKLISLKIYVATRMEKSILGINLQIMKSTFEKTEIVIKTLGMVQLFQSHTGLYIKNKIIDIIKEYDIEIDQIFRKSNKSSFNI